MKVLKSNKLKVEGGNESKGSPYFFSTLGSSAFLGAASFFYYLGAASFLAGAFLSAFTAYQEVLHMKGPLKNFLMGPKLNICLYHLTVEKCPFLNPSSNTVQNKGAIHTNKQISAADKDSPAK